MRFASGVLYQSSSRFAQSRHEIALADMVTSQRHVTSPMKSICCEGLSLSIEIFGLISAL
ncbi:MAG: hypothetical protein OSB44_04390 [Verrucomicrobiales bacterium]|nr:hypothetical protein [Verrucomicrobiales bacterium]